MRATRGALPASGLLVPAALALGLAGCTTSTGVRTTLTFAPARYLPQAAATAPVPGPTPPASRLRARDGSPAAVIRAATRGATIDPDGTSMDGATWMIEDARPSSIYRVRTALRRVTTILLPPGERFNGAVGGDVESFLINVAYAGPRPAVSILPRTAAARGNLQLVTTGGFYSFDLITNDWTAVNLVDVSRAEAPPQAAGTLPQPQGDFTRLALQPVDGAPLPAWAPAEAWADSVKMVVRFHAPLPVLPALLAGQEGEQLVSYRSLADGQAVYLLTNRRVTEAELRLGAERVRLTVDPDAIAGGAAADPSRGAEGWRTAPAMPAAPATPIMLLVQPPPEAPGTAAAAPPPAAPAPDGVAVGAPSSSSLAPGNAPPPARQPMADRQLGRI